VLREEQILFETRTTTEESGIETIELLANEQHYNRACEITETWQAAIIAEQQEHSGRRCPKCGSKHLDSVQHDKLEWVTRCKDCGCLIAR